jgi:hypothetical protein
VTTPTTTSSSSSTGANLTQLLSDLDSATSAVAGGDWVTGGLDGVSAALDLLGSGSDPLSSVVEAGFGLVMPFIQFLQAPLQQLTGDGNATSSGAQSGQSAGQSVNSLAGSYQQAASTQTDGWSGSAASNYQSSASDLATELRAIAKSTTGVASAVTAAGKVVASTQQQCGQLVSDAATKINAIMTPAMASAPLTGGASIAAAIPQVVGVATVAGGQIAQRMGSLLSSGQNLAALVLVIVRCLEVANTALNETTSGGSSGSGASASGGSTSTGGTGTTSGTGTGTAI